MKNIGPLLTWAKEGGVKAPVLIYGGSEDRLKHLALESAAAMWCEQENGRCGACRPCRQVKAGIHPDLLILETEKRTMAIKSIRRMIGQSSSRGMTGKKAVIIRQAEKMTIPAANAVLKTLEESHAGLGFILTTRWPSRLLATVRSRCFMVNAGLVADEIDEIGEGKSLSKAEIIRKLGSGQELSADELEQIRAFLSWQLRKTGPTPGLRRTMGRLRDYYRIEAAGGNVRLAKDVLLGELAAV